MINQSPEEKEFSEKQKTTIPVTLADFKNYSDRELLERQTFYLLKVRENTESIKKNAQFWFYVFVVLATIGVLVLVGIISQAK